MYESLPKIEKTFSVDLTGETTGTKYAGTFTVKCVLQMGERHAEELEMSRLQADLANPSNGLFSISLVLAKLRGRITESPDWWKQSKGGATLLDGNVTDHLFDECMRLEDEWKLEVKAKAEEVSGNVPTES